MRRVLLIILLAVLSLSVVLSVAEIPPSQIVYLPKGPICPLFYIEYPDAAPPNSNVPVRITVKNIGSAGYCTVRFNKSATRSFQLNYGDSRTAEFTFTMPSHPVKILVESYPFGNGSDYTYAMIALKEYKPQGMILTSSISDIKAGEIPEFSATVINIGSEGQVNVNWSADGKVVCRHSFSLKKLGTAESRCSITPPKDKNEFNVSVVVFSSAGTTDSLKTVVHVLKAYPIPKITGYEVSEFQFGAQGKISLNIENVGNASGPVSLFAYAEMGYGSKILLASKKFNLSERALVDLYIPARPLSTWYSYIPLSVKVCSLPSVCDSLSIKANISSSPRILITFFNMTTKGPVGSTGRLMMRVVNTGNAPANLRIEISNLTDILWRKDFTVSANSWTEIYYTYTIPSYKEGLDIILSSAEGEVLFSRSVVVEPFLPPDAVVVRLVNLTSKAVVGSSVTIAVTAENRYNSPIFLHFSFMNRSSELKSSTSFIGARSSYTSLYSFTMPSSRQELSIKVADPSGNVLFSRNITIDPVTIEEATPSACPWIKLVEWWPGTYGAISTTSQTTSTAKEPEVVTITVIESPPSSAAAGDTLYFKLNAHNGKSTDVKLEMTVEKYSSLTVGGNATWWVIDNATYTVRAHSDQLMEALVQKDTEKESTYRVTVRELPSKTILFQQTYTVSLATTSLYGSLPLPELYTLTTQAVPPNGLLAGTFWISNPTKFDAEISVYIPFYNPDGSLADFGVLTAYQVPPSNRFPVSFVLQPPSSQTMRIRVAQACPTDYTKRTVHLFKADPSSLIEILHLMRIPDWMIPDFFRDQLKTVLAPSGKLYYPFSSCNYPSGKEIQGESIPIKVDPNLDLTACTLSASAPSALRPGDQGRITFYSNCSIAVGQVDPSINVIPNMDLLGIYYPSAYHNSPYTVNFTMPNHDVTFLAFASAEKSCIVSKRIYVTVKVNTTGPVFWISDLTYDQFAKPHKMLSVVANIENKGTAGGYAILKIGNSSQTVYLNAGEKKQVTVSFEVPEHSFSMPVVLTDDKGRIYEKHSFNVYTTGFIKPSVSVEYPRSAVKYATVYLDIKNLGTLTPGVIWYRIKTGEGALLAGGSLSTLKNDEYIVGLVLKVPESGLNATLEVGHKDPEETKTDYTQQFYIAYNATVQAGVENLTYPRTALPTERINISFWAYSTAADWTSAFWILKDSRNGSVYASGTLSSGKQLVTVPLQMPYHSLDLNLSLVHYHARKNVTDYETTFYVILENGTGLAPSSFLRGSRFFMPFAGLPSVGFVLPWKAIVVIILLLLFFLLLFMRKFIPAAIVLFAIFLIALPLLISIILIVVSTIILVLWWWRQRGE